MKNITYVGGRPHFYGTRRPKKKRKVQENASPSPWWNSQSAKISNLLPISRNAPLNQGHLNWITTSKSDTFRKPLQVEFHPPREKKIATHTTGLSEEVVMDDEVLRSLKVRILPTMEQKEMFHHYFEITRFIYNKCIDWTMRGPHKPNFTSLKKKFLTKNLNPEANQYPWVFNNYVPRDCRDMAIQELCSAIATTKESLEAKGKDPNLFEMKYRSKKDKSQRFMIPNNGGTPAVSWDKDGFQFWPRKKLGVIKPKRRKDFEYVKQLCANQETKRGKKKGCMKTVILKYEYPGRWFMIFPHVRKKKEKTESKPIVVLDPGIRTFQVGYDSTGKITEYGDRNINRIFLHGKKMDKLQSKIDRHVKRYYENKKERIKYKNQRRRWRVQLAKMSRRNRSLINDAHWQITKDLVQNYDHIMASRFKISDMVKKGTRRINSENVRKMLNWSHFSFRQKLKHKAEEYNKDVYEVSEHYTVAYIISNIVE